MTEQQNQRKQHYALLIPIWIVVFIVSSHWWVQATAVAMVIGYIIAFVFLKAEEAQKQQRRNQR